MATRLGLRGVTPDIFMSWTLLVPLGDYDKTKDYTWHVRSPNLIGTYAQIHSEVAIDTGEPTRWPLSDPKRYRNGDISVKPEVQDAPTPVLFNGDHDVFYFLQYGVNIYDASLAAGRTTDGLGQVQVLSWTPTSRSRFWPTVIQPDPTGDSDFPIAHTTKAPPTVDLVACPSCGFTKFNGETDEVMHMAVTSGTIDSGVSAEFITPLRPWSWLIPASIWLALGLLAVVLSSFGGAMVRLCTGNGSDH